MSDVIKLPEKLEARYNYPVEALSDDKTLLLETTK